MKKILFALIATAAFLIPFAPRAQADADVSINFFYDNLSAQGNWIDVGDYGYCFQPNVAANNPNWRPYTDGYWAYTDDGWTWVSYEDFGWATYHYGRWTRLTDYGWVWVPGDEWAPAWVSWRTGGDYVGWAPLPPAANRVYEGRAITGHVDIDFDIGPSYYNFVDVRYIGEPVLRNRIIEPQRNVTVINRTVNVTNITYRNSRVYSYGPDYNRLNSYSTRPIQRLSIQRENNINANTRANGHNFNRVNGRQLVVVAPNIRKGKEKFAPKRVKAKVRQPKFEHGWQGVSNRQQLQAEMKKENAKNIPPPNFKPQKSRQDNPAEPTPPPRPHGKPFVAQPAAQKKEANARRPEARNENANRPPQTKTTQQEKVRAAEPARPKEKNKAEERNKARAQVQKKEQPARAPARAKQESHPGAQKKERPAQAKENRPRAEHAQKPEARKAEHAEKARQAQPKPETAHAQEPKRAEHAAKQEKPRAERNRHAEPPGKGKKSEPKKKEDKKKPDQP